MTATSLERLVLRYEPSRFPRSTYDQVGTTTGLSQATMLRPDRPEQVYVLRSSADVDRPVVIEGWVGYDSSQRLHLTHQQAKELIPLLLEAMTT